MQYVLCEVRELQSSIFLFLLHRRRRVYEVLRYVILSPLLAPVSQESVFSLRFGYDPNKTIQAPFDIRTAYDVGVYGNP